MTNKKEKILITGSAGFIGMSLCQKLLRSDYPVFGVDNLNSYYDPLLKKNRLKELAKFKNFMFEKIDISNLAELKKIFKEFKPDKVVNLAAQAGVSYSLENPQSYIKSNIDGFLNILECCKEFHVKGLVYASSSSVYGASEKIPFSIEDNNTNLPISIYAVTKKTNELMAYSYNHLYNLHTTGLRFFTVYGPWGRPDMAIYKFVDRILKGKEIDVYNHGLMERDFTYIDDIVDGILAAVEKNYFNEIFNLGNSKTEKLMDLIKIIEINLNKAAKINFMDIQLGEIKKTFADIGSSKKKLSFSPQTSLNEGVSKFINWFKKYHEI